MNKRKRRRLRLSTIKNGKVRPDKIRQIKRKAKACRD